MRFYMSIELKVTAINPKFQAKVNRIVKANILMYALADVANETDLPKDHNKEQKAWERLDELREAVTTRENLNIERTLKKLRGW